MTDGWFRGRDWGRYTRVVVGPIRFVVTLDGVRDARRLQQRQLVIWTGTGLVAVGLLAWWLTRNPGGVFLIVLGLLTFIEWRYPIFDKWFDRRRLTVGSECEVWLEESAVHWRQGRAGAFDVTGQLDWSRVTGIREDDRAILVMDGRVARIGIPKSAFTSAESLARFRDEIRQRMSERPH